MDDILKVIGEQAPWAILLLSGFVGLLVGFLIVRLIKLTALSQDWKIAQFVSEKLTYNIFFFVPLVFLFASSRTLIFQYKELLVVYSIIKILLIAITTWLVVGAVNVAEKLFVLSLDFTKADNLQERRLYTKVKFIKRIVVILVILFGISVLLLSFDSVRKFGVGMLTSAGIASVILGFAAQKSLANLLAGIQIAFTQPIKIDDVVIVEGEWGRIEEINLTYVVVNIWDLRRLVLPITYFIETPFQNWSRNDTSLIGMALFRLNYKAPISELRNKLFEILQETPLWDGKSWALQVTDTEAQFMLVRATMSARNSSNAFDLRCLVREKLIEFIIEKHPEALPSFAIDSINYSDHSGTSL
jgi:small-conductance mechanosensitive channel